MSRHTPNFYHIAVTLLSHYYHIASHYYLITSHYYHVAVTLPHITSHYYHIAVTLLSHYYHIAVTEAVPSQKINFPPKQLAHFI
jgi:hypothetical protein